MVYFALEILPTKLPQFLGDSIFLEAGHPAWISRDLAVGSWQCILNIKKGRFESRGIPAESKLLGILSIFLCARKDLFFVGRIGSDDFCENFVNMFLMLNLTHRII